MMSCVVVLAGGKSQRMGRDKLTLSLEGQTLLESAVNRFQKAFKSVYLSVADENKYPEINAPRIVDIFPGAGPMSGLHAALTGLDGDGIFLVAADLPFASPDAAKRIIELCGNSDASVLRLSDGLLEPLFGFYRKPLLGACEKALREGRYNMTGLLSEGSTRFVAPHELEGLWNERLITNINFPEDYAKLPGGNLDA